ncbi:MAG: hypothetical protein DRH23_09445 [Deltaproteobacteria bacterium]|nr:MAG: hypothetical protein DRH23_09445 [Deltaproteobacteria bacterium]
MQKAKGDPMKYAFTLLALGTSLMALGCGDEGGVYCCTYESRHSACGGGDYTAWATNYYEFNIDDYLEGWSPTDVCDKFSGTDTTCSATCCIYSEDRNTTLSSGSCAGESI